MDRLPIGHGLQGPSPVGVGRSFTRTSGRRRKTTTGCEFSHRVDERINKFAHVRHGHSWCRISEPHPWLRILCLGFRQLGTRIKFRSQFGCGTSAEGRIFLPWGIPTAGKPPVWSTSAGSRTERLRQADALFSGAKRKFSVRRSAGRRGSIMISTRQL